MADIYSKKKRSEIAQKKHWREKAQKSSSKVTQLETELAELKKAVKKPDDDKEAAAQDYIRNQARQVFEELQKEKAKDEAKQLAEFEEKVEAILDDNPDISEEELLEVVEEFEVTPAVALKILKKNSENKSKKPKMPKARGASPESKKELPDDSKKSMFEILKEEREKLKNNLK